MILGKSWNAVVWGKIMHPKSEGCHGIPRREICLVWGFLYLQEISQIPKERKLTGGGRGTLHITKYQAIGEKKKKKRRQ